MLPRDFCQPFRVTRMQQQLIRVNIGDGVKVSVLTRPPQAVGHIPMQCAVTLWLRVWVNEDARVGTKAAVLQQRRAPAVVEQYT